MAEKRRMEDDWRELGIALYHARRGLVDVWVKSSEMFGGVDQNTLDTKELYRSVGELMMALEARYAHDDRKWTFGNPDPIFGAGKAAGSLAKADRS